MKVIEFNLISCLKILQPLRRAATKSDILTHSQSLQRAVKSWRDWLSIVQVASTQKLRADWNANFSSNESVQKSTAGKKSKNRSGLP